MPTLYSSFSDSYSDSFDTGNSGVISLTLPLNSVSALGIFRRTGTGSFSLPIIHLNSLGFYTHKGTSAFNLPVSEVDALGNRILIVTGALNLPINEVDGVGNRWRIGTGGLYLPVGFALSGTGNIYKSGIELDAYNAIKHQLQNDYELGLNIETWIFDNKIRILLTGDYPVLQLLTTGIPEEKYIAYPMNKLVTEHYQVRAKIYDEQDADSVAIRLGENIKDAFEKSINWLPQTSMIYIKDMVIKPLSDAIRIITLDVDVVTRRFHTSERN